MRHEIHFRTKENAASVLFAPSALTLNLFLMIKMTFRLQVQSHTSQFVPRMTKPTFILISSPLHCSVLFLLVCSEQPSFVSVWFSAERRKFCVSDSWDNFPLLPEKKGWCWSQKQPIRYHKDVTDNYFWKEQKVLPVKQQKPNRCSARAGALIFYTASVSVYFFFLLIAESMNSSRYFMICLIHFFCTFVNRHAFL